MALTNLGFFLADFSGQNSYVPLIANTNITLTGTFTGVQFNSLNASQAIGLMLDRVVLIGYDAAHNRIYEIQ